MRDFFKGAFMALQVIIVIALLIIPCVAAFFQWTGWEWYWWMFVLDAIIVGMQNNIHPLF